MTEDLETLLSSLDAEPEVEVNYDAPESGSFPPQLYPGRYDFIFHLDPDKPFDKIEVDGHPYLSVTYSAGVRLPDKAEPATVRYLRASFYKHPKMTNSDGGELLRCLGVKPESLKASDIVTALRQADGRAGGSAIFGWEARDRDTEEIFSTSPRKKARKNGRTDMPWPKGGDGRYAATVTFPESGASAYGREFVVSYKLPKQQ